MERVGRRSLRRRVAWLVAAVLAAAVAGQAQEQDAPFETPAPPSATAAPAPAEGSAARDEAPAGAPPEGPAAGHEAAEANADVDTDAAPRSPLRVTPSGTFDVNFLGTDVRLALRLLGTQSRKNIIATKGVSGTVTADLYGVTFQEALEAILASSGFVYTEEGNFIYVMTPKQLEEQIQAKRRLRTKVFRLAYVRATDAKTAIQDILSEKGKIAITPDAGTGIQTSSTDTGGDGYACNDVLVVTDYEEHLQRIEQVLRDLDVRPAQVLIAATVLRATLTEDNALGIDFNALGGVDFQGLSSTSPGLQSMSTGDVTGAGLPSHTPDVTFRTDFNSAVDTGGLTIGFVANETAFFIRALESVTDVTVLANPKLLVVNKHRGEVMVGNRDGYLTTTVTETTATQTVEFLETGTRLVVRPYVARDGYIRLEMHPEDSSGDVVAVGQSVLPSETTTEVTSNVMVRDGHTIVIGGLFRERTSNSRAQVPLLGNIPVLGAAFRRTIDDVIREEVIVLVTPRIVQHEADEAVSEQLRDDVERFRVGQRRGLRWWGRNRLAEHYLRRAKQDLRAGRRGWALWNVDMTLSLEPRMEEAIRLKERLTEKAYWADRAQYSAAKYIVQRMIMNEMGLPVERVIPPRKPRDAADLAPEVRKALGAAPRPEDPLPPAGEPPAPADEPAEAPEDTDGKTDKAPPLEPGARAPAGRDPNQLAHKTDGD
jgi:type IV pilus assembly protein PilQ